MHLATPVPVVIYPLSLSVVAFPSLPSVVEPVLAPPCRTRDVQGMKEP